MANGPANNRQRFEVTVGKSRLLLALNVSYLCRNRSSVTSANDVRFGSLAALFTNISLMAAFGGEADMLAILFSCSRRSNELAGATRLKEADL